jgi:hypothetical protein
VSQEGRSEHGGNPFDESWFDLSTNDQMIRTLTRGEGRSNDTNNNAIGEIDADYSVKSQWLAVNDCSVTEIS